MAAARSPFTELFNKTSIPQTAERGGDPPSPRNEKGTVASGDCHYRRGAEKAAEIDSITDASARRRDYADRCRLVVDHADGGFIRDDR